VVENGEAPGEGDKWGQETDRAGIWGVRCWQDRAVREQGGKAQQGCTTSGRVKPAPEASG